MRIRCGVFVLFALAACTRAGPGKEQGAPELPLPALRVVLASQAELAKLGPDGLDIARRAWVGPIDEVLAEETPDAPRPMHRVRLPASRAATDALFARGLANLRAASPQPIVGDRTVQAAKAQVQITRFADSYTTARLLLPELWSKIAAGAGGHLYAAAPARDLLLWTTSVADADQRALRRQAQIAFQSRSDPISPAILRWTDRGWALEDANPIPSTVTP